MIPMAVIALLARMFAKHYTRTQFENVFYHSGTTTENPNSSNKLQTATDWLKMINRTESQRAISILGKLLEDYFEGSPFQGESLESDRDLMHKTLNENGLRYVRGGTVVSALSSGATKTVESLIRDGEFPAVLDEFTRATHNVETEPREAASAAANILEAICKEYIVQHSHLEMPARKDLSRVFDVVRKDLGFDPASIEDDDLRQILTGMFGTVNGIAALRTHASSAHAQNTTKRQYRLAPRHARLAVSAAHTVLAFILETWAEHDRRVA
jgi:hypothetical protein